MCFSRRSLLHNCLGFWRQQSGVRLFNVVNEEICHIATEVLSDDDAHNRDCVGIWWQRVRGDNPTSFPQLGG
jgi:hypothetical protein